MKLGLTLSSTLSFFSLSSGLGIASAMLSINSNNVEQHTCLKWVISEIKNAMYYFTFGQTTYFFKLNIKKSEITHKSKSDNSSINTVPAAKKQIIVRSDCDQNIPCNIPLSTRNASNTNTNTFSTIRQSPLSTSAFTRKSVCCQCSLVHFQLIHTVLSLNSLMMWICYFWQHWIM